MSVLKPVTKKISSEIQLIKDAPTKSRPHISILPDDPKERQKHVIKMVLERFSRLSLKYSTGNNDCSTTCPICNNDHKKENIRNYREGIWGSGEYRGEKTYRSNCWGINIRMISK